MSQRERPLSPFMIGPYYRPQITSVMSILHRITGVVLSIGAFFLTAWLAAVSLGPDAYAFFSAYASSIVGKVIWAGVSFSLMYHLFNGLRHLPWDLGHGFSMAGLYRGGWIVIGLTTICTALLWFLGFSAGGAA